MKWKEMTREQQLEYKRERTRKYRRAGKLRQISAMCVTGSHASCAGRMVHAESHTKVACQCYCHLSVCPRCKQPASNVFRNTIHAAANSLETQAKQIRKFLECVQ
jgi:hypothetical protein